MQIMMKRSVQFSSQSFKLYQVCTCGKTYVVQRISCQVDPLAKTPIDPEGKVIVCVIRDPLALQDELDDPRTSGLGEKVRTIDVESETQHVMVELYILFQPCATDL